MSQLTNAVVAGLSVAVFSIRRHRINLDGPGIRTLVCLYGCALDCKYCINPHCKDISKSTSWTPNRLYEQVKIDHLYFTDTGGGITFGGGEPGNYYSFIHQFRKLCPVNWTVAIETTLNYPSVILNSLIDNIDYFIVDIKDISSKIYSKYTLSDNEEVIKNLKFLASKRLQHKCLIRIPKIPNYNTDNNVEESVKFIQNLGYENVEVFGAGVQVSFTQVPDQVPEKIYLIVVENKGKTD
jgi:pyruvate formate lyase activating enzyme